VDDAGFREETNHIVAASSFYNLPISGTFYIGFTAFFDPLRNHFGWSSARTALGVSLQRLESGIAAPLIGYLFDRVGPRKLIPDPGQAGAVPYSQRTLMGFLSTVRRNLSFG
jgi:hypothetical protein